MRRRPAAVSLVLAAAVVLGMVVYAATGGGGPSRHRVLIAGLPRLAPRAGREGARANRRARSELGRLIALGLPIYCGGPHGHEVALTFDDGPGVYTHYAVKKLRAAHERATFFVVGKSIRAWPRWLERELGVAALGDHTYTHPDLLFLSPEQVELQFERTARLILAKTHERVRLWRPPYGAYDAQVRAIARRLGLLEVLWDVDSRDWAGASWDQIVRIVEAGLQPGAIVLMHENHGQTIRALTELLPYLRRRHLRSVSIPQLLASDPPSVAQVRRGYDGCPRHRVLVPGDGG